ncbi:MAG: right-handed parallel beta-helix repeat-containing protein [Candidatus Thermoplasmatota archaeon]|nr:right-handed parallel beta-helix repeat-containing protein [Candidatus Thermoplasmatota archaeon]
MFFERRVEIISLIATLSLVTLVIPLYIGADYKVWIDEVHVGPELPVESIQLALDLASEGTTVVVHAGEYHERLMITKGITLKAAPGEDFKVTGGDLTRGPPGTKGAMVTIASSTAVTIDGGNFSYTGDGWDDAAIKIQYGNNHQIENANFSNSKQGIWVHGNDHEDLSTIKNIRIINNTFTNISGHAIYLQGTWAEVENNHINDSCDGIMVAFGWTAPDPVVGSISDNSIVNCSVGINIVDSRVFHYEDNDILDCKVGELLNNTQQESKENRFIGCEIGTRVINNSAPLLVRNTYTDCSMPVVIDRCEGLRAYENVMTGTDIGFMPIYEYVDHLDHEISQNNTIEGNPVFYSFGDNEVAMVLEDFGQVFIANSSSSSYSIKGPSPCPTSVLFSESVDIGGSRFTTGLEIYRSEIYGEDVRIGSSVFEGPPLHMAASEARIFNSTIEVKSGVESGVVMSGGSDLDMFNSTTGAMPNLNDAASSIRFFSYIGLEVLHQDGGVPVDGAHYTFMIDDVKVHASSLFGGSDPETDPEGKAGPFWINYGTMTASADIIHELELIVNATADRSFEGSRSIAPLDARESHTEVFIIDDIERPSAPKGLLGEAVPDGDANRLTWEANTDDARTYRIYYQESSDWTMVGEVANTRFDHVGPPDGTLAVYRVTAVDEVNLESLPSTTVEVMTEDLLGPDPPRDLRIYNITDSSFVLSWKGSLSLDAEIYEVHLIEVDATRAPGNVVSSIRMIGSTPMTTLTIHDMSDAKNAFAVRALDEVGNPSVFSNPVSLEASDLTWPSIFNIEWITGARTAKIAWTTDEPTTCTLWLGSSLHDLEPYGPTILGTEHICQVEGLQPDETYYFYIYALEPSGNDVIDNNEGGLYSFTTLASEGYLSVRMTDQDSEPVSGIQIHALGGSVEVRLVETSTGVYEAFLLPGNWTVRVLSSDHSPVDPVEVEVHPFLWTNISIELTSILWERANLTIMVIDETGNTVQGALVEFEGEKYTTGPGGKATIEGVKTGKTYRVKITAEGFKSIDKDLYVPVKGKDQTETVTIMHEDPKPSDSIVIWILLLVLAVIFLLIVFVIILVILKRRSKAGSEDEDTDEVPDEAGDEGEEEGKVKKGKIEGSPGARAPGAAGALKKGRKKKEEKKEEKSKEEE